MASNSTTDSSLSILCQTSHRLAVDPAIYSLYITRVVFGALGILANIPLWLALWRHKSLHPNLRILLFNHSICAALLCVCIVYESLIYLIWRHLNKADPCGMVFKIDFCYKISAPKVTFLFMIISGTFVTALERAIATWQYKTYETKYLLKVSVLLIIAQVVVSLALSLNRLGTLSNSKTSFCTGFAPSGIASVLPLICVGAALQITAIILYAFTLYVNKKRQDKYVAVALQPLTVRYQLRENIKTTQMLIPCVIFNAICWITPYFVFIPVIALQLLSNPMSSAYDPSIAATEWIQILAPLYSIGFPVVYFRSPMFRSDLVKMLPRLLSIQNTENAFAEAQPNTSAHFDILVNIWHVHAAPGQRGNSRVHNP